MSKKQTLVGLIMLLVASLFVAACSAQQNTPEVPTIDPNEIYTQAAQTVQAGIALTQASQPTVAPSSTLAPTNTMDPNMAAGLTATANAILNPGAANTTPAAGQPTQSATLGVILPTATKAVVAPPPKATGDKAELVGQSPADGSSVPKSASFDVTLVLKNTGTTTWTTKYALVFYAGDRMGSPTDYQMPNEVKPGETVKLVFTMKASDTAGKKKTIWAVRNADGVNFYDLWLEMNVSD